MGNDFLVTRQKMTVEKTISRATEEIANGRLWRAKEILSSSISTYGYSRPVLQQLGEVLLQMSDDLEAGKFLLLSTDKPNEKELVAIELFLKRYGSLDYQKLLSQFPARVRLFERDDYPELLRSVLLEKGAPETLSSTEEIAANDSSAFGNFFWTGGCILLLLATLVCFGVGAITIWEMIWKSIS